MGAGAFVAMAVLALWIVSGWSATAPRSVAALQTAAVAPATAAPAAAAAPAAKPQALLRLAGSGTIGAQLGPALAEAFLASLGATGIQTSPRGPDEVAVQGSKDGAPQVILVSAGGSSSGFAALLDGSGEVGLSSRRVRPDEAQKLAALGPMTSPANEHVLGLDGIAVIVSKANPVDRLGREQLAAVFGGRTASWSALGGTAGPIHLYLPDEGSGTPAVFQALAMRGAAFSPGAKRLHGNQAVAEAVVADVGGIGLVALPWVRGVKALAVGESQRSSLIPNAFTLAGEDYFLTRRLYLYTAQAPANPFVSRFVEFALGPAGQAAVRKAGFVDLTIKAEPRTLPDGAPAEYARFTSGARRLSTTFRFAGGSAQLDNRGLGDLDRVVEFLREHDLNGASVRLLGFTDNHGGAAANKAASRSRALRVAQALAQRGVGGASLEGFGAALPVSDNASEEGRDRNRRVEIWITH